MRGNVESLVPESLRSMRADMASVRDGIGAVKTEMLMMRQHMACVVDSQTLHGMEIAGAQTRLERIERRLELID